ncbi:hypothetical protein HYY75_00965 [bacterium]|nr:hypothetical protein [bacterium]
MISKKTGRLSLTFGHFFVTLSIFLSFCFLCLPSLHAEKLVVPLGKTTTLKVSGVKKVMAVKEGVIEVLNVADDEIIISGVGDKPSTTQLIIWDLTGRQVYDVETFLEIDVIQQKFSALFPDPQVSFQAFPDVVFLKGGVVSEEKSKEAYNVLKSLLPDRPIQNLIEVKQTVGLDQKIAAAINIPTVKVTVVDPSKDSLAKDSAPQAATGTVSALQPRIILEGTVKTQNDYVHMVEVVRGFSTGGDVKQFSNLVTIENPIQVVFQAYVLQVNRTNVRDLGIEWGGAQDSKTGLSQGSIRFVENISNVFRGDAQVPGAPVDNWPNPFKFNNINRFEIIAANVRMWEEKSKVKVLANPKLTVYANATPLKIAKAGWTDEKTDVETETTIETDAGLAFVNIGQDILYQSGVDATGRNPSFSTAKAALKLMVRDLYVFDGKLKFSVFAKQDEPSFPRGANSPPDILKRSIMTTVQIPNGETIVLGGLINTSKNFSEKGIPGLSRIPYLGRLFRTRSVDSRENELIILLTPEVVGEEKDPMRGKKFETVPIPRRSERLEQLHDLFQKIKSSHFPEGSK